MATTSRKELSRQVSGELDELGFDRRRIRERIHVNNLCSRAKDMSTKRILNTDNIEKIFVGSRREGIGLAYLNDMDILQINHGIVCVKGRKNVDIRGKLVFRMVQHKAPQGYTFLKLVTKETNSDIFENIKYALEKKKNGKFLSSKQFMTKNDDVFTLGDGYISRNTYYETPNGPSIPKYVKNDIEEKYLSELNLENSKMDYVRAFPCYADSILQSWKTRERKCGWPTRKTIAHVMTLPAYVVPVGQRGSVLKDLQWRISLTMAELHLVQSLNNIQMKVLVLMKLIAKHILQPVCKDMTSYTMKIVMLWLAEQIPQKKFRQKHLTARLNDALKFLESAVKRRKLPCYMNPKKNLFANKLCGLDQRNTILQLNFLSQHGTRMIHDYFQNLHPQKQEIMQLCEKMYTANFLDKVKTCQLALLTTQQLAEYYLIRFFATAWWHIFLYSLVFNMGPFLYTYGRRGYSDPLSCELSQKLADSERNEEAALRQDRNKHRTILPTTQGCRPCRTIWDTVGLLFKALVLCLVIFLKVLRFLI